MKERPVSTLNSQPDSCPNSQCCELARCFWELAQVRPVGSWVLTLLAALGVAVAAQQAPGAQQPEAPRTARAMAPVDLTGTWVPLITEDWRFRMVTPPRGDVASVPVNDAGRKAADAWDPARDAAAGEQCKAYGAAGLMRLPLRARISWQDDATLKLETDNGQQTRLFRFAPPESGGVPSDQSRGAAPAPPAAADWQGHSVARWETMPESRGVAPGGGGRGGAQAPPLSGGLTVVTTNMRPGYLRRNGVPYSARAVMTEHLDTFREPNGDTYLIISTTVEDPTYLNQPFITSTHFKKEADNSKWNPRPCEITQPVVGK
jgi:hypothetical protein